MQAPSIVDAGLRTRRSYVGAAKRGLDELEVDPVSGRLRGDEVLEQQAPEALQGDAAEDVVGAVADGRVGAAEVPLQRLAQLGDEAGHALDEPVDERVVEPVVLVEPGIGLPLGHAAAHPVDVDAELGQTAEDGGWALVFEPQVELLQPLAHVGGDVPLLEDRRNAVVVHVSMSSN